MKKFRAELDELPSMLAWIREQLFGFPDRTLLKIELACEEAIVNIIRHAKTESLEIEVQVVPKSHAAITFADKGPPFNPLEPSAPDLTLSLEEREPGGLGLFLIRQNMDELSYARKENRNHFTMIKRY